jgi:hypothetical protein
MRSCQRPRGRLTGRECLAIRLQRFDASHCCNLPKRSLFSVLIELPWWFSVVVAGLIYALGAIFNPLLGAAAAIPFVGVACYTAWLRLRRGPMADFPVLLKALRSASPEEMRAMLTEAFSRQRYDVTDGPGGDLELQRNGYLTLVRFRRWRAQSTHPAAVKELSDAVRARGADHGLYITTGTVTDAARKQADTCGITLIDAMALANLVVRTRGARKAVSRSGKEVTQS